MFTESAELYDLIYSGFKDYEAEADTIAALIHRIAPAARTVLDVGCGTGEHARLLRDRHGLRVDGLDLDERMLEQARTKVPSGRFFQGDMADFQLADRYDVVLSLFSSIGYVRTLDRVEAALHCFRRHLDAGGRVIVEPWLTPDVWTPGMVRTESVSREGLELVRMSHSAVRGRLSVLTFDYLIGRPDGVQHRHEVHELGLFTTEEMLGAFAAAGLAAEHDSRGPIGRGLYVAAAA